MKKKSISLENETYISPDIEVLKIETEQNLLAGGSGTAPIFEGEDW